MRKRLAVWLQVEELEPRRTPAVAFGPPQTFAFGASADAVVVGAFNGDGKPDLAVANQKDNTVSVLLNTTPTGSGTTSFAAPQTFAVGGDPVAVAVGDFNGDGKPDLAVVNEGDRTVSVLLNTTPTGSSTVSFATQQTFATGAGADAVTVADFNGDGKPDLVVGNESSSTVSVMLNTTASGAMTASFAAQQTFAAGTGPVSVAVADFNGDGKPDLAVGGLNVGGNGVAVLLNTTAAGSSTVAFAAPQTFAAGIATDQVASAVAVGDFNGDGKPDLAVAIEGGFKNPGEKVSVLLNTTAAGASTASFAAPQTFGLSNEPYALAVGDFNGDGKPDLALALNVGSVVDVLSGVAVLLNATAAGASTSSFTNPQTFALGGGSVAAGDFNGDGKLDLAGTTSVRLNASVSTVVGQFGGQGVWQYNRATGAWGQRTAANASLLATNVQGDVAGVFHNNGVWLYTPAAGWQKLNGVDATALALDAYGDIVANFPGYGVGEFLPGSGWVPLTGANAVLLAISASGEVAAEFPGQGVWLNPLIGNGGAWQRINGQTATALAIDDLGDVVANFRGVGVGEYRPATGWQVLNGIQATALTIDWQGDVAAQFARYGVGEYVPGAGWRSLTGANAAVLAADDGFVAGAFTGHGVWEFDPTRGWFQLTAADATALASA